MKPKKPHQLAVRTSISLPPPVFDIGHDRCRAAGYATFSRYIETLIRLDRERNLLAALHR